MIEKIKPKSQREWIKLFIDILIIGFAIFCLLLMSYSFREGYELGKITCYNNFLNYTDFFI